MDKEKIAYHVREILKEIGENPDREGLLETPVRVARMYEEVFRGIAYSNTQIAEKYAKVFDGEQLADKIGNYVVVTDIPIFSFCEHHIALMYNMKVSVIYKPVDKIIGLSKIARIAEMVSRRLQVQERIGTDIAEIMQMATGSTDVGVYIEGEHSCMTMRGIKKPNAKTRTTFFTGEFEHNDVARGEALLLLAQNINK